MLKDSGMTEEEIESERYYNSRLCLDCVDRRIPPPSKLYWRVRAVFVLYGSMKDSKTQRPLFNDAAWGKARNVLKEILLSFYVDLYLKRIKPDGSAEKNKYGMDLIECMRGIPQCKSKNIHRC